MGSRVNPRRPLPPSKLKATTNKLPFKVEAKFKADEDSTDAALKLAKDPLSIYPEKVRRRPFRIYGDCWLILEWRWKPKPGGRPLGYIRINDYYYPMEQIMRWDIEGIPDFINVKNRHPKVVRDWSPKLINRFFSIPMPYRRLFLKHRNVIEFKDRIQELADLIFDRQTNIQLDRPKLKARYHAENRSVIKLASQLSLKAEEIGKRENWYEQILEIADTEALGIKQFVLLGLSNMTEHTLHLSPAGSSSNPAPIELTADEKKYIIPASYQAQPDPRIQEQIDKDPTSPPKLSCVSNIESLSLGPEIIRLRMLHCSVDSIADQLSLDPKEVARWIAQYRSMPQNHRAKYHQRDVFATLQRYKDHAEKVYKDLDDLLALSPEEQTDLFKESSDFGSKRVDIDEVILYYLKEIKATLEATAEEVDRTYKRDRDKVFTSLFNQFLDEKDAKTRKATLEKLQQFRSGADLVRQSR